MRRSVPFTLLLPLSIAAAPPPQARPVLLESVAACHGLADGPARLACYDAAVSRLLEAQAKREIVIVDREQVRQTRRTLFGLALPRLNIFGGDKEDQAEQLTRIETTLDHASRDAAGRWLFVLADGARWRQIDDYDAGREPRRGSKIVVTRAALGSFKLSVDGASAVRVRREN